LTGNLLAAPGSLFLIDWEFATTGPASFDLGSLMGNLMMAVLALQGMDAVQQQQQQQMDEERQQLQEQVVDRQQQAEWLLQVGGKVPCEQCAVGNSVGFIIALSRVCRKRLLLKLYGGAV
jgi:thiamine kinase-like enzyme